ncbi:CHAT domain-containing protein [Actinocrispum wychmicini]
MPARSGTARLRCNLYFNQVLVQSRLVQVMVTQRTRRMPDALRSVVDFRIADPATSLADTTIAHAASLHLEGDGRGTHELRVVADGGTELLCAGATIRDGQLATQIKLARSALQRVAWGTDTPWREGLVYRYATPAPYAQLTSDLINLAVNGFRLHHLLLRGLGQTRGTSAFDMACTLGKALRRPGYVQFALRDGAQHVLPAALLYDLPLDTQAPRIQVCADFEAAMRAGQVLGAPCFGGTCRQVDDPDDTVVCPGGFWGYRHALGLPVSVGPAAGLPSHLDGRDGGWLTGGVYCDFQLVDEHRTALLHLLPGLRIELAENRRQTFDALREIQPHVVYFYCHGGVERAVPYLRVGRGTTEPVITPDNLFHKGIRWAEHRPLVFLNGCRTTDLSPESAIEFVSFFVQDAWACGVIGTEITVFESLAAEFAEECLRGFLAHGLPIGLAVRQARIALLARGNPLGLAYVPFVAPAIQFRRNHKEFDRAA